MACEECQNRVSGICSCWDTYAIVFWVDIEEASFLNAVTSGILRKAGDVDDAETGCVVGLVGETIKSLWKCQYLLSWKFRCMNARIGCGQ